MSTRRERLKFNLLQLTARRRALRHGNDGSRTTRVLPIDVLFSVLENWRSPLDARARWTLMVMHMRDGGMGELANRLEAASCERMATSRWAAKRTIVGETRCQCDGACSIIAHLRPMIH